MAKLLEMNGAEMASALVSSAGTLKKFMDDEEFMRAFNEATKDGMKKNMHDVLKIYANLMPLLFGEKHLKDTVSILAAIEGTTASKMLKMNGAELLGDALKAWKEQIAPFFLQLGLSVGE